MTAHGHGSPKSTSARALTLVLLAVQLLAFSFGAALAGQGHATTRAGARAVVSATTTSIDGAVRPSSSDARVEAARAGRGHGERAGAPPPIDLACLTEPVVVAAAWLSGCLDLSTSARDHGPVPSVVNGARGPPQA